MVRTSERRAFKTCRWRWDREFNDLLKPATPAPALRFGSLVHAALAKFYKPGVKRGPHPAKTFAVLYEAELEEQARFGFKDEDGTWHDALELGTAMLEGYIDLYGKDDRWKVVATECPFEVPVDSSGMPVWDGTRRVIFTYVGVLDGIWMDTWNDNELFIPDHKTAAAINTNHLTLDEQAGAYWTYGVDWLRHQRLLKPQAQLSGMLFNFLRKALPDDRPRDLEGHYLNKPTKAALVQYVTEQRGARAAVRAKGLTVDELIEYLGAPALQLGEVSKSQPPPLFHREPVYRDEAERLAVRDRVLEEAREMRLVRRGRLAAYKNPSQMTCGGCGYKDICELEESGADWESMAKSTMTNWDAYAEHEIYIGR